MRSTHMVRAAFAAIALAGVFPASAFAQADLSVDLADGADPVTTGSEFAYSASVANGGPEAASGVALETTLPNEVDFVAATASQGTCDIQGSKRVICSLGELAAGTTATAEISVRAQRDGVASATATASATGPADPNQANDSSTEETTIQEPAPVQCAGRTADIVGTAGDDVLTGTRKADVIAGRGGADTIVGLDGNDVVCGGRGDDTLRLGRGNDLSKGGGDEDRIRGAAGDDVAAGNSGDDDLGGGAGSDALKGNSGDDDLGGGRGGDALKGGAGTDRCRGGRGADRRRSCE